MRNLAQFPLLIEDVEKDIIQIEAASRKEVAVGGTQFLSLMYIKEFILDHKKEDFEKFMRARQKGEITYT